MEGEDAWDALGTWCEMLTVREKDLPRAAALARARVEELESACTGADSELAGLAIGRPQRVGRVLALALAAMRRAAEFTEGLVAPGWQASVLDLDAGSVTVPAGTVLDVGTSVRGWAADWIARDCVDVLGVGCLVNLGGDIAVRGEVPESGWQVEVDDSQTGSQRHPVISMGWPGGLATRSSASGEWRSVTVAARNCERASSAAGAAIGMGDGAPRWLTQRELPARLVDADGVVVQTNGWPRERWIA